MAGLNNRLAFLVDKVCYYDDDEGDDDGDGDHCDDGDGHWTDNDGTDYKEDHILYQQVMRGEIEKRRLTR